jgi:hypothetical protein
VLLEAAGTAQLGDIVNLNKARKSRARQERAGAAARNRARHGESKVDRTQREGTAERANRKLDQHLLEKDE